MSSSFDLEAARRLPLADAALRLLEHVADDEFLMGVFDRHRGRSYQDTIAFPLFVHLITDALLGHHGSAHQTFQHAQTDQTLETTVQAMYGKLRRVPLELSLGLFTEAAARLRSVAAAAVVQAVPASLSAFWVLGFDGKKIKYVARRLGPLRGLRGEIYGGKLLVVQDLATRQAVAAAAVADGEAADNPLVPAAVARVRAIAERPRLWVGDRAFCDFKLLGLLSADADHFLVRFNTSCGFHPDPDVPQRRGIDDQGRPYQEEWGWLGKPNNPHRIYVRKITLTRPANDDPLVFVTSLIDAKRYPALDLLSLYRSRWGLEVMFQRVVQTFDLRHLISGTPQATVFQAMLCLLLYNITMIIRDYVAKGAQRQPEDVSLNLLFDDILRDLTAWMQVISVDATVELLRETAIGPPEQLRHYLQRILARVWTDRWQKAPTRQRPPKPPPRAYICGGHSSVAKILRQEHHEIPFKPNEKKKRKTKTNPPPFETKKDS
jgi:hypothetical protein